MARSLSNYEYRQLLAEAQPLAGARLEKAYEVAPALFRLDFGKRSLMVKLGECFYLTSAPPPGPQQPTSIAMQIRKHLDSQRLVSFTAYQSDRIYVLEFISGCKIILEQFSGGNLFLLDASGNILRPYHFQPSSARSYKSGQPYPYPNSPPFDFPPTMAQWQAAQSSSPAASLSATLSRWPIGKLYTSEAIARAGLSGASKVGELTDAQAQKLLQVLSAILSNPQPGVYEKADAPGQPVELSLTPLSAYAAPQYSRLPFSSWSEAVEYFFTRAAAPAAPTESPAAIKLRHRLAEQEQALQRLGEEISMLEPQTQWLEQHLGAVETRLHELQSEGKEARAKTGEKIDLKNKKLELEIEK